MSGEYLAWWQKATPVSPPLLIINPTLPLTIPTLAQPGTQVLFGGDNYSLNLSSGARINAGLWLGSEQTYGAEFSGFVLGQRELTFSSDAVSPNGPTGRPFIASNGTSQTIGIGPSPGSPFTGTTTDTLTNRLSGLEINGLLNVSRGPVYSLDLLAGARYLNLDERLHMTSGELSPGGVRTSVNDDFHTPNQFWGGQIGARLGMRRGAISAELTPKFAMGSNSMQVNVEGSHVTTSAAGVVTTRPVGVYAQQSNSGNHSQSNFAGIFDLDFKLGYDVTSRMKLTVGYDFIYWSKVVRPGDQIDPRLNRATSVFIEGIPTGVVGNVPAPVFQTSSYWVQGINMGLQFSY